MPRIQMSSALKSLEIAIDHYARAKKLLTPTPRITEIFLTQKDLEQTVQESMIWRFKLCVNILFERLKEYLENVEKITLDIKSPRATFRALAQARLINEQEADTAIEMVDSRNKTSHVYKEEIAEQISKHIIKYHTLMVAIIKRIKI